MVSSNTYNAKDLSRKDNFQNEGVSHLWDLPILMKQLASLMNHSK